MKWSAGIEYDQGRCGRSGCYGLESREDAIAWLDKAFDWRLCWFLLPSCWIAPLPYTEHYFGRKAPNSGAIHDQTQPTTPDNDHEKA